MLHWQCHASRVYSRYLIWLTLIKGLDQLWNVDNCRAHVYLWKKMRRWRRKCAPIVGCSLDKWRGLFLLVSCSYPRIRGKERISTFGATNL